MVGQRILIPLIVVRAHAPQPILVNKGVPNHEEVNFDLVRRSVGVGHGRCHGPQA